MPLMTITLAFAALISALDDSTSLVASNRVAFADHREQVVFHDGLFQVNHSGLESDKTETATEFQLQFSDDGLSKEFAQARLTKILALTRNNTLHFAAEFIKDDRQTTLIMAGAILKSAEGRVEAPCHLLVRSSEREYLQHSAILMQM